MEYLLDELRFRLNDLLSANTSRSLLPIRLAHRSLNIANDLLGSPICSRLELDRRRGVDPTQTKADLEKPPVFLYVTADSADRAPIEQILAAHRAKAKVLDVSQDQATVSFIKLKTGAEPPVVFIGEKPVGGLAQVKNADASGDLKKLLAGEPIG